MYKATKIALLTVALFPINAWADLYFQLIHHSNPTSPTASAVQSFVETLQNELDSGVNAKIASGGVFSPYETPKLVATGQIELAIIGNHLPLPLGDFHPSTFLQSPALSLPFLFGNEHVAKNFAEESGTSLFPTVPDRTNICPLGMAFRSSTRLVFFAQTDDLRSEVALNGAVVGSPLGMKEAFDGAKVTVERLDSRRDAFRNGRVVGVASGTLLKMPRMIGTVSKPINYHFATLVANCDWLHRLRPEERAAIEDAAAVTMEQLGTLAVEQEALLNEKIMSQNAHVAEFNRDDDPDDCDDDECSSFGTSAACNQTTFLEKLVARSKQCCSDSSVCPQ